MLNIYIVLSLVGTTFALCWFCYSYNIFNSKQKSINLLRVVEHSYSKKTITSINISTISQSVIKEDLPEANKLGVVAFPYLGIYLPIYDKPYDQYVLKKGANQLKAIDENKDITNTDIGQGNLILVAHNYSDGQTMFSALQQNMGQLEPYIIDGSLQNNYWLSNKPVYVATKERIYEYVIDHQEVISKNNVNIRTNTTSSIINIITCLEPEDNMRIVTFGKLNNQYTWQAAPISIVKYFDTDKYPFNVR